MQLYRFYPRRSAGDCGSDDQFGLFGLAGQPANALKLGGFLLILGGIVLMQVAAKRPPPTWINLDARFCCRPCREQTRGKLPKAFGELASTFTGGGPLRVHE